MKEKPDEPSTERREKYSKISEVKELQRKIHELYRGRYVNYHGVPCEKIETERKIRVIPGFCSVSALSDGNHGSCRFTIFGRRIYIGNPVRGFRMSHSCQKKICGYFSHFFPGNVDGSKVRLDDP